MEAVVVQLLLRSNMPTNSRLNQSNLYLHWIYTFQEPCG
jgi:hypothetical protein